LMFVDGILGNIYCGGMATCHTGFARLFLLIGRGFEEL
jgi:hypothetical protein